MKNSALLILTVVMALTGFDASGFTVDDLVRDYDAECSFMESGLFTTTDIQWHSVEHKNYVVAIVRGDGDDGLIIKNFIPGEADLKATFAPSGARLTIPVQEWPFEGYEFCHGSDALQYSDDAPVVVRVVADASSEFVIDFPQGSWGVRDAQYGDYMSIIRAKLHLTAREKSPDGIVDIAIDADSNGRYYNLQGVEVASPTPGIYIYRTSSKCTKVFVK